MSHSLLHGIVPLHCVRLVQGFVLCCSALQCIALLSLLLLLCSIPLSLHLTSLSLLQCINLSLLMTMTAVTPSRRYKEGMNALSLHHPPLLLLHNGTINNIGICLHLCFYSSHLHHSTLISCCCIASCCITLSFTWHHTIALSAGLCFMLQCIMLLSLLLCGMPLSLHLTLLSFVVHQFLFIDNDNSSDAQ